MSSSPFIKRAKGRSNIRSRDTDSLNTSSPLAGPSVTAESRSSNGHGEDDDEGEGGGMSPMLMAKNRKKDKDRKKVGSGSFGKSKLSFGVDDEESEAPAFIPRKSNLSQSMSLQKLAASTSAAQAAPPDYHNPFASTSAPSPVASASSSYTSSYLDELKASTPTRISRRTTGTSEDGPIRMDIDDPSDMPSDSNGLSHSAISKYSLQPDDPMLDTTQGIPDEALIAAAKAKRKAAYGQKVVSGGGVGGEDYISITEQSGRLTVYDADAGTGGRDEPHPESRLQREEDELGEGDEDLAAYTGADEKLTLGKSANAAAARRLRNDIVEAIDEREMEDVDDEDEMEWEMAQASRANVRPEKVSTSLDKRRKSYKPAPIPATRPLPTMSSASSRLESSAAFLLSAQATREKQIEAARRELNSCDTQETELREEVIKVEGKREWMEEFFGWVEMLGGFLEEKMPVLQRIETDMMDHYKERHDLYTKRRHDDDSDDLALCLGIAANDDEVEEEVDEMGRTRRKVDESGAYSGVRRYRREDRIARRRRRQARNSQAQAQVQEEGYSTDSSLGEADQQDYQGAQEALQKRVAALSSDVKAEDFRDPEKGLAKKFGGWRSRVDEDYDNAFGGLAMVQGWEYWARQEMIGWEPGRSGKSLDSFDWYQALYQYSRPKAATSADPQDDDDMDLDEESPLGTDGDLAAAMISSAVTGIITNAASNGVYDVYSTRQTRRLTDLIDMTGEFIGKTGAKYRGILRAILTRFSDAVQASSDLLLAVTHPSSTEPPAFDPASRTALATFVRRRIKLSRNLLLWRRFAQAEVAELVVRIVRSIILPSATRTWQSGGAETAAMVLEALPAGILDAQLQSALRNGHVQ